MSALTELSISGIRAFDNYDFQNLLFNTPLTLICGANGVGKTTIIECLRYATTGDLPPNSKGGAFIHDPKMSSKSSVKAQIRLKFRDSKGCPKQVTRSMQLTVSKKNVYSMKTLDGYLVVDVNPSGSSNIASRPSDNLDLNVKSARHADLNVLVPQSLGIPPAILNYVMFCHQEDSLWPLSEASQVKKKFDEIFEATRYTKALDNLKVLRRDYAAEVKLNESEVRYLHQDRERVEEKWRQVRKYEQSQFSIQKKCTEMRKERTQLLEKLSIVQEHRQYLQRLEYTMQNLETHVSNQYRNISVLQADISEQGLEQNTLEDLQSQLAEVGLCEEKIASDLQAKRAECSQTSVEIDEVGSQFSGLKNRQGRLQEMVNINERRILCRKKLVAENSDVDGQDWCQDWTDAKQEEAKRLDSVIEELEIQNRQREERLAEKLNSQDAKRLQYRQQLLNLRENIRRIDSEESELRDKIKSDKLSTYNSKTEMLLVSRIEELKKNIDQVMDDQREFDESNVVKNSRVKVRDLEFRADESRKLVQTAITTSDAVNRVSYLKDSQIELENTREDLFLQLQNVLSQTDANVANENVLSEAHRLMTDNRNELETLKSEKIRLESDIEINQSLVSQAKENLVSLKNQRAKFTRDLEPLRELAEGQSGNEMNAYSGYETAVKDAEEELMEATEQEEQLQFAHSFFTKALELAKNPEAPICLLCEHHKTPKEASVLVSKLKHKLLAFEINPDTAHDIVEKKQVFLQNLRRFQPAVEGLRQLNAKIEEAQTNMQNELESNTVKLKSMLAQKSKEINSSEQSFELFSKFIEPLLIKIERNTEELSLITSKINLEKSLLSDDTMHITPKEAQDQQEQVETSLKQARLELDSVLDEEKRHQQDVFQNSSRLKELKLKLNEYRQVLSEKQRADEKLSFLQDEKKVVHSELAKITDQLPVLDTEIDELQKELRVMKFNSAQSEREVSEKRSETLSLIAEVNGLTSEIVSFTQKYGENPLDVLLREIATHEQTLQNLKLKLIALNSESDELLIKQSNMGTHRRNLSDAMKLKQLEKDLQNTNEKLKKSKEEYTSVQKSFENTDWKAQLEELQGKIDVLEHDMSAKSGESKAIGEHIAAIKRELETNYHKTYEKYQEALGVLKTNKGVIGDLEKYVKVMDSAIMQYHSNKMTQINSLLDQMWRQTYTGTDIDTILIKSESESTSTSVRANYNYRVCMVKRDTELDMRGRCSAGQKVLACIIIRMVLAESFGPHSGLIVLDEPTTNLDVQNISALARSLHEIIGGRIAQQNFQLIVITHDENFLSLMNPAEFCEDFYLIRRDSKQLSRIERKPISSLGYEV